ncbi:MAG: magnesium/cobalt transporter CorA [Nitrospiraceae bacterium]
MASSPSTTTDAQTPDTSVATTTPYVPPGTDAPKPKAKRRRSRKAGLPPGTLVPIGETRTGPITLTVIQYNGDHHQEGALKSIDDIPTLLNDNVITWINISGLHDLTLIEKLGAQFQLHPLVLEDIVNTEQRPKWDDYVTYAFVVAKALIYTVPTRELSTEQISIIFGQGFVLTFQENGGDPFGPVRERLRTGRGRLRTQRSDYLVYTLLDAIVDNYFGVLEGISEVTEQVEDLLLTDPKPEVLKDLYRLRRSILFVRRAVWPLREVIGTLQRGQSQLITEFTRTYLADVYDHTIQVIDAVEALRDLIAGMLELYLSSASNRMTAVMKVLTVITTIFMPLTFIAGIYGMNFEYMPELKSPWGYPLTLLTMLGIALGMLWYFHRKRWL